MSAADPPREVDEAGDEAASGPIIAPSRPCSVRPENIRALRVGHGANCSSVGSVIDTLFLASAVGGAIFAAVCAAMREEPVRVVGVASRESRSAEQGSNAPRTGGDDSNESEEEGS